MKRKGPSTVHPVEHFPGVTRPPYTPLLTELMHEHSLYTAFWYLPVVFWHPAADGVGQPGECGRWRRGRCVALTEAGGEVVEAIVAAHGLVAVRVAHARAVARGVEIDDAVLAAGDQGSGAINCAARRW